VRRVTVFVAAVACALAACSSSGSKRGSSTTTATRGAPTTAAESDAQLAADAYVWGYPLVVTERTLQTFARYGVNRITFQLTRSTVSSRTVVAPNTDTLYAVSSLDLRNGPLELTVPAITDRYYAFQFIDAYTDSFAYVGTRATRGRGGSYVITPPGWKGTVPAGTKRIASPTTQLILLGRFLVADDADVARVHAVGRQIRLAPLDAVAGAAAPNVGTPKGTPQSVAAAGAAFFDELGDALAINAPVDATERATLQRFARLGIGAGRHPTQSAGAAVVDALATGVREGDARILAAAANPKISGARTDDGWSYNLNVGTYGHDALVRAVVAKSGWGANIPAEAVYAHASADHSGAPLTGASRYVIHFPAGGLPPVHAFWSVTLYGPDRFFVANPIDRYALGDRSAGLVYGSGHSLDLYLQHTAPAGHEANWLPTPTGRFSLTLRLYLPDPSVLAGEYAYPVITKVG
jgi:hypothetical protein